MKAETRSTGSQPLLRTLAVLIVLAGLVAGGMRGLAAAAQTAPEAIVQIRVHSCPDDLDATGFFQHLTRCTSERGLYGVAIGVKGGRFDPAGAQFQYSRPDGSGQAALMTWPRVGAGGITATEVAPDPIRPSVAFCSLIPGNNVVDPDTLDGDEVPVVDGVMSLTLARDDTLICDWYRFPGGVTADDGGGDDEDGDDGDADPDDGVGAGGAIYVKKWVCVLGEDIDSGDVALDADPGAQLAYLSDACSEAETGFDFGLSEIVEADEEIAVEDEAGEEGADAADADADAEVADGDAADPDADVDQDEGYPDHVIGGQEAEYIGWSDLDPGVYRIQERVPDGYSDPYVICDGSIAGIENVRANFVELAAPGGEVAYDVAEDETLTCEWFNVAGESDDNGEADDEGDGDDDNHNGNVDARTNDLDNDGLIDADEADVYGTDPDREDTDGDGVGDGDEITFGLDPLNPDTDLDGYTDGQELYELGSDPLTDDLLPLDDDDGDFLLNGEEINTYGTDPRDSDSDRDGLSDYLEVITYGTDPNEPDTDGDGRDDAMEADAGMDPLDPNG